MKTLKPRRWEMFAPLIAIRKRFKFSQVLVANHAHVWQANISRAEAGLVPAISERFIKRYRSALVTLLKEVAFRDQEAGEALKGLQEGIKTPSVTPNPLLAKFLWLYEAPEWRKDTHLSTACEANDLNDELEGLCERFPLFKVQLRNLAEKVWDSGGLGPLTAESFAQALYRRFGRFQIAYDLGLLPERFEGALEAGTPPNFISQWAEYPILGAPPITQEDWDLVLSLDLNDDAWDLFDKVVDHLAKVCRVPAGYREMLTLVGGDPEEISDDADVWDLGDPLRERVKVLEAKDPKFFDKLVERLFESATPIPVATTPIAVFREILDHPLMNPTVEGK